MKQPRVGEGTTVRDEQADDVDPSEEQGRPVVARVHDFLVGGRHHRPVDREFAAELLATVPGIDEVIREQLRFRPAVVAHLAALGLDQYLDLGSGLPTVLPTHEVAAQVGVRPRVVYLDRDPEAVGPARELLAAVPDARVVEGDVAAPADWLPEVAEHLDLERPVAVIASAVLHHVDDDAALVAVRTLRDATAPGSRLAIAALSGRGRPEPAAWARHRHGGLARAPRLREPEDMTVWLEGYDLEGPGWVAATRWAPHDEPGPGPAEVGTAYWGVLARRR